MTISHLKRETMDFRQRLEQNKIRSVSSETPAELEDSFSCPFFAIDRSASPACLDLRLPGGIRKALPYSYFTEMSFDAEKGIEIVTTGKTIKILGRNLAKLFDYLISYRVRYVQANIGSDLDEEGLFVKEIRIEDSNP